jgi:hypothetical protein
VCGGEEGRELSDAEGGRPGGPRLAGRPSSQRATEGRASATTTMRDGLVRLSGSSTRAPGGFRSGLRAELRKQQGAG